MSIDAIKAVVDLIEMGGVVGQEDIVKCLRSAIEQAEKQEPYAWEFAGTIFHDKDEVFGWWDNDKDVSDTPPLALYTAPPQSQPLTDEEIEAAWQSIGYQKPSEFRTAFARAIERAHGIGGGK